LASDWKGTRVEWRDGQENRGNVAKKGHQLCFYRQCGPMGRFHRLLCSRGRERQRTQFGTYVASRWVFELPDGRGNVAFPEYKASHNDVVLANMQWDFYQCGVRNDFRPAELTVKSRRGSGSVWIIAPSKTLLVKTVSLMSFDRP
jgi:hypothetical protein